MHSLSLSLSLYFYYFSIFIFFFLFIVFYHYIYLSFYYICLPTWACLKDSIEYKLIAIKSFSIEIVQPIYSALKTSFRSTAIIPPAAVKGTLLHLFDVGSPSRMTLKEKQDTLRTLQKFLTNEIRGNSPVTSAFRRHASLENISV